MKLNLKDNACLKKKKSYIIRTAQNVILWTPTQYNYYQYGFREVSAGVKVVFMFILIIRTQ